MVEDPVTNVIDYVQFATLGNASDFGDATAATRAAGGLSNDTRGIAGGGYNGSANVNTIDTVEISTLGNATDFGDLIVGT